ncbi:cytochrome C peroxidase [Polyangium sp. 6x1]|uniref:cytochrome C peroxidase n=1 Tax=Polyangium sp. 6x1 TaxID=3042689 RepID=UPI00248295A7|nr:cytochrome C peroxidase [Polyangium sp. 6x1]MDI1442893.1 cytochrome C peroxidase [Polyangium sp. 6x1]
MSLRSRLAWSAPLVVALAGACTSAPRAAAPRPPRDVQAPGASLASPARNDAPRVTSNACARRHSEATARPESIVRQSSTLALARHADRTIAYVADADRHAIHTIDIDGRALLATTPLAGAPSQLVVLVDGRVVVALRDSNRVAVLEPASAPERKLAPLCEARTPSEPVGLFVSPNESTLFVTSGWGHALTAFAGDTLEPRYAVPLPREPRAVLVEPSGRRAFVSHAVGDEISVVDLEDPLHTRRSVDLRRHNGEISSSRRTGQGFVLAALVGTNPERVTRLLAPLVSVDQDAGSISTETYGSRFLAAAPLVAVVDTTTESLLGRHLSVVGGLDDVGGPEKACTLPRAAALAGDRLLLGCLGVDAVLELDARARDPMRFERRRFRVPAGPMGVAAEPGRERAVVWSQFAAAVSVLDLREGASTTPAAEIVVSKELPPNLSAFEARGRLLFHATNDPRISGDGRACASCHIDGREDGITWQTPEGRHQTIMLAGRMNEGAPFGWRGETTTLRHHVGRTMKRLAGRGVFSGADSADLDALLAYLKVMPAPVRAEPDEARRALVARGRELFDDPQQGCAACHPGGGTDRSAYDVARSPFRIPFDTPSLQFVGGTAPYFHDGRYATLGDLLRGVDGTMGHTGSLSNEELSALEAYLEEL